MNLARKRPSNLLSESVAKRRKSECLSIDFIRNCLESAKGESIQALYRIFGDDSFSFENIYRADLAEKWTAYLNLQGYAFVGYGDSKTGAKSDASKTALRILVINDSNDEICLRRPLTNAQLIEPASFDRHNSLPDVVSTLVHDKYNELANEFEGDLPWFHIIAGIVAVQANDNKGEVLVVCTGSKCIDPVHLQTDGTTLIDCHAEILALRAFRRFLYAQMEQNDRSKSLFVSESDKYEWNENARLYLFVNSAPCGDARIFTVSNRHNNDDDEKNDNHPNKSCRGLLRMKINGGSNTIPVINYLHNANDRFGVMSCSDKLLKVNALGMQGSLLSQFYKPIYLSGIVIGQHYQASHLVRAMYGRLSGITFPSQFRLHEPKIYRTSELSRTTTKSPKTCINWIRGEGIELVNSTTGKLSYEHRNSRLCKRSLFESYLYFRLKKTRSSLPNYPYYYWKNFNDVYREAKTFLYQRLNDKQFGKWINRDSAFEKFSLAPD